MAGGVLDVRTLDGIGALPELRVLWLRRFRVMGIGLSHGGREGTPEVGEVGTDNSADEPLGDDGGWGVDGAVGWVEEGAVDVDDTEARGIWATLKEGRRKEKINHRIEIICRNNLHLQNSSSRSPFLIPQTYLPLNRLRRLTQLLKASKEGAIIACNWAVSSGLALTVGDEVLLNILLLPPGAES